MRGGQTNGEGGRGVKRSLEENQEAGFQGTSKVARGIGAGRTARGSFEAGERAAGGRDAAGDRGDVEGPLVEDVAGQKTGGQEGVKVSEGGDGMVEGPETDEAAGALFNPHP